VQAIGDAGAAARTEAWKTQASWSMTHDTMQRALLHQGDLMAPQSARRRIARARLATLINIQTEEVPAPRRRSWQAQERSLLRGDVQAAIRRGTLISMLWCADPACAAGWFSLTVSRTRINSPLYRY